MKKKLIILLVFLSTSLSVFSQIDPNSDNPAVHQNSRSGFLNTTEINFAFGLADIEPDYSRHFVGMTSVFGLGIIRNLDGGIGAGISFYNGGMLFPLYLDLRYSFNFGRISTYGFGDGGLLFDFTDSEGENRLFINPGAGISYHFSNKLTGNIGAGLFLQTTKDKSHDSFINFKLGITYEL